MKLDWSPLAMADRDAIFDYIEADNPQAAIMVDERIAKAATRLITFPESGRRVASAARENSSSPILPIFFPTGSPAIPCASCG